MAGPQLLFILLFISLLWEPDIKDQDIQKQLHLWGKLGSHCAYPGKGRGSEKTEKTLGFTPQADPWHRGSPTTIKNKTEQKKRANHGDKGDSDFQSNHIICFQQKYYTAYKEKGKYGPFKEKNK